MLVLARRKCKHLETKSHTGTDTNNHAFKTILAMIKPGNEITIIILEREKKIMKK